MAKEFEIPEQLFEVQTSITRKKHANLVVAEEVWLSDEQPDTDQIMSKEIKEIFN